MGEVLQQVLIVSVGVILSPVVLIVAALALTLAWAVIQLVAMCAWAILCLPYQAFKEVRKVIRAERGAAANQAPTEELRNAQVEAVSLRRAGRLWDSQTTPGGV